jgi:hypothetical protein
MCYSFFVLFPSENSVVAKESRVEILGDTVVIVLWKDTSCQGAWQTFKAGPSHGNLAEREFLTVENVDSAVKQMENSVNDPWRLDVAQPVTCNVHEMTDKCVTLQVSQSANSTAMESRTDTDKGQPNPSPTLLNDRPVDVTVKSEARSASTSQFDKNFSQCWPCLEDEHGLQTETDERPEEGKDSQETSVTDVISNFSPAETSLDTQWQQRAINEKSKDVAGSQQDKDLR